MLVIRLNRDVDSQTFWNALNGALAPRLKSSSSAEGEKMLQSFGKFFSGSTLSKESEVRFIWRQGSLLSASISGPPQSGQKADNATKSVEYKSKQLCDALLDVYVGSDPVSPSLVRDMENRV